MSLQRSTLFPSHHFTICFSLVAYSSPIRLSKWSPPYFLSGGEENSVCQIFRGGVALAKWACMWQVFVGGFPWKGDPVIVLVCVSVWMGGWGVILCWVSWMWLMNSNNLTDSSLCCHLCVQYDDKKTFGTILLPVMIQSIRARTEKGYDVKRFKATNSCWE